MNVRLENEQSFPRIGLRRLPDNNIVLAFLNDADQIADDGIIAKLFGDGTIELYPYINADLARQAGMQLTEKGRIRSVTYHG